MSPAVLIVVVVAALLALLVLRAALVAYPPKSYPSGILSAREQALIAAAADAFFPPSGPIPISGTEAGLVAYMDDSLRDTPRTMRRLTRLLFVFIEFGPWIFGPFGSRFTRLSQEGRLVALGRMGKSPIYFRRVAFLSMRALLSMGYFANDTVSTRIGCLPCLAPFDDRASRSPAQAGPHSGTEAIA